MQRKPSLELSYATHLVGRQSRGPTNRSGITSDLFQLGANTCRVGRVSSCGVRRGVRLRAATTDVHSSTMRVFLCMAFLLVALGATRAADDADTLTHEGVRFRLDGIDAPELDQPCLDSSGEVYLCGRKAYEELRKFIANRALRCDDKGPDSRRPNRRIGQCSVDNVDLQRWLVANGWAIPFEPYAKGRFKEDETDARGLRAGLWDG